MSSPPKLVTLLPSTDCDLGRWLLEWYGIDYVESPHAPICHVIALKYHGYGKDAYPLLLTPKGNFPGVTPMVSRFDVDAAAGRKLLPDDPDLEREVRQDADYYRLTMGGGVVNWAYWHFLPHKWMNWPSFTTGVPWFEKLFVLFGYSILKSLMTKGIGLSDKNAAAGLDEVYRAFDSLDKKLIDGRPYLHGDRPYYSDLAFAASAAPMVLARGYGGHLPAAQDTPPEICKVVLELRDRPAGEFIQRMYDTHRLSLQAMATVSPGSSTQPESLKQAGDD